MNNILLILEHDGREMKSPTLHAVAAANKLNGDIHLLVIGKNCDVILAHAKKIPNIKKILVADHAVYEYQLAENTGKLIADIAKNYHYLLAGSSTFSKNCLPYAAALLDVNMLSDVSEIVTEDTFKRLIYAGNVEATVQSLEKIKVMTIRNTAFPAVSLSNAGSPEIEIISKTIENKHTHFKSHQLTKSERPDLTNAKIVVSGGRALKSAENFKLIESLADTLHAAIGASRAAVDAGFVPNDYQVGQTGKVVAPDLYIAVGISGAIQHLAGMKDSKIVVSINQDPDAPIFASSDYYLVGDLFEILPQLTLALEKSSN